MEKNNRIINVCDAFNPHGLSNGIFIPDAICELKTISAYAKACWGKLKQYAGQDGFCSPTQEQLAKDLCLSLSTVQNNLKQLEKRGLVRIEKPTGLDRIKHLNNTYYL